MVLARQNTTILSWIRWGYAVLVGLLTWANIFPWHTFWNYKLIWAYVKRIRNQPRVKTTVFSVLYYLQYLFFSPTRFLVSKWKCICYSIHYLRTSYWNFHSRACLLSFKRTIKLYSRGQDPGLCITLLWRQFQLILSPIEISEPLSCEFW